MCIIYLARNKINGKSYIGQTKSESYKAKLSESKIGEKSQNFGKTFSNETRRKMSLAQSGSKHPMFGKHHSNNTKERIKNSPKLTAEQRCSIF